MDLLTFIVVLVSVICNIVFALVAVCLYKFVIPPSAMLLIKKRMGRLKDSMLAFVCYDDGAAIIKPLKIKSEGCLEQDYGDGTSETYFIAKPTVDTDDRKLNRANYELDKVMLPSLSLDGISVALCYILDGVATNANVLLGLQTASMVNEYDPGVLDAEIKVPVPVGDVVKDPVVGVKGKRGKAAVVVKQKFDVMTQRVKVLLPINPLDIHRAFKQYWDQSMLHATKQRHQNIGAAKSRKDGKDYFKLLVIAGVVVFIGGLIGGIVAGFVL